MQCGTVSRDLLESLIFAKLREYEVSRNYNYRKVLMQFMNPKKKLYTNHEVKADVHSFMECYSVFSFVPLFSLGSCFNLLYTGRLFHCYMLVESFCHFRGVGSVLTLYSIFDGKSY